MGTIQTITSDDERDRLRPHVEMLVRFALALDVTTDEYLELKLPEKKKRGAGPKGIAQTVIEALSKLPRHQQEKIIDVVESFVNQHSG